MEIFFFFFFGKSFQASADYSNLELLEVLNGDGDVYCAAVDKNSRTIYKDLKKKENEDWKRPLRWSPLMKKKN